VTNVSGELTPGELGRAIVRLESTLTTVNARLDNLNSQYVRHDLWTEAQAYLRSEVIRAHQRMDKADERATANFRLAISALFAPLVVGVLLLLVTLTVR